MDVCIDKWFGMKTVDKKNLKIQTKRVLAVYNIIILCIRNSFGHSRTSAPRAHDKEITMSDIL